MTEMFLRALRKGGVSPADVDYLGESQNLYIRIAPAAACFEPWLSLQGSAVAVVRASLLAAECHATGTAVGDVIELDAIGSVYGDARPADQPLRVASVKGNIGHAEMAAGIFSIAKVRGTVECCDCLTLRSQ
jgi:hypothetical protein